MQQYGQPDPYYGGSGLDVTPPSEGGLLDSFGGDPALWSVVFSALGFAVAILVFAAIARSLLHIARPNEALVFSGKKYTRADGVTLPYRVLRQGERAFRIPVLERVDRMDMRLLPIDIVVQNAYSAGNIPLQIHAIANVKISSEDRYIGNAVERFLGRSVREIQQVAQQTLEGAVREVIATLTPEQVNEDRLAFAERLATAAADDLAKLGLTLDVLKIQTVADGTGYLDSLGRPKIAAALRDAENSENEAAQEITAATAESGQRAEVAKAAAEAAILELRNELRRVQAELEGEAQSVEREADVAAKTARAEAERELQSLRAALEERRLQADVVIPAEVHREARAILAVGEASPTAENGAAQAKVLELMGEAWRAMGPQAKEIYVIQHLEQIVGVVVSQLQDVQIGEVNVLDDGSGQGLASYAATYPQMVTRVMEALAQSTGVDVPALLAGKGGV
ncbi:MAG: SPFH domain-containing protein [Myxococcota bacterium]|jgi:flotillin|nr:SPFH domain-containing protein [Myxococcota bacterium]